MSVGKVGNGSSVVVRSPEHESVAPDVEVEGSVDAGIMEAVALLDKLKKGARRARREVRMRQREMQREQLDEMREAAEQRKYAGISSAIGSLGSGVAQLGAAANTPSDAAAGDEAQGTGAAGSAGTDEAVPTDAAGSSPGVAEAATQEGSAQTSEADRPTGNEREEGARRSESSTTQVAEGNGSERAEHETGSARASESSRARARMDEPNRAESSEDDRASNEVDERDDAQRPADTGAKARAQRWNAFGEGMRGIGTLGESIFRSNAEEADANAREREMAAQAAGDAAESHRETVQNAVKHTDRAMDAIKQINEARREAERAANRV